jgi:putative CocE/NonD family hydrolase
MRYILADLRWSAERFLETLKRYFVLPFFEIPSRTPDRFRSVVVQKGLKVPMRDGVHLNTNVYQPRGADRLPVVMTRMPYGINEMYCFMPVIGRFWARKGYAFVVQDVRGRFDSEGEWDPFVHEIEDGCDTLEWISAQPWCDGNIGATGESYYGYTTWAAALSGHPNLKCIAPSTTAMDIYGVWIYNHGAFCLQTMGTWAIQMNARRYQNPYRLDYRHLPLTELADEAGIPCSYYKDWIRHPARDDYWERINLDRRYADIHIPVLHLGGWYDTFLKATLADWRGVREKGADPVTRQNQWLAISPIDHEGTPDHTHRVGRVPIGEFSDWSRWEDSERFFDYWLKGMDNGFGRSKRVKLFVIGENDWIEADDWPLPETEFRQYYFHSDGFADQLQDRARLDRVPPQNEAPDTYVYDPNDPLSLALQTDLWHFAEFLRDRAEVVGRPDVLSYTSAALEHDLPLTGPIAVTLYAASSAPDTDFTAALVDVFPDGYCHLIQEGVVRARFRDSDREPSLIEPGVIYRYRIGLWSTSYVIRASHRVRVEISSSNFNRFDRNPNTGDPFGQATEVAVANQTVYHDELHPSHIVLPVVGRASSVGGSCD